MIDIEFDFSQLIPNIKASLKESFQTIINKYIPKSLFQTDSVNFFINGKQIVNQQIEVENLMNNIEKENKKLKIEVKKKEKEYKEKEHKEKEPNEKKPEIINSKDIICPRCKEPCRIEIKDYKIKFYECPNGHVIENINIFNFSKTQKINESHFNCENCKLNNKNNSQNDEFFRCLNCQQNLCLSCKSSHDSEHNIILYNQKNCICQEHNKHYIKYCSQCNKNICDECEEHIEHDSILFKDILPNIEEKKNILKKMKICIDKITAWVKEKIVKLNEFNEDINNYLEINKTIFNSYDKNNLNFQILKNFDEINDSNEIYKLLKNINLDFKSNFDLYDIFKIHDQLNERIFQSQLILEMDKESDEPEIMVENKEQKEEEEKEEEKEEENNKTILNEKINEMTIIYKTDKKNKIRLFGQDFVQKNKNKCYLIIDNEKSELKEFLEINKEQKEEIKIKLCESEIINDISSIFKDCTSLISLPDISNWDSKNINNMSSMFYGCTSLISFEGISNWNTTNVTDMYSLFKNCTKLKLLPDISKWDTKNVVDMGNMFYNCCSLKSLPDISKWDTKKVIRMNSMFEYCNSLISLPDISKWDVKNVVNMSSMFHGCHSLKSLPDISKWDIKNVVSMTCMFSFCVSLNSFPDITNWEINKDLNTIKMFDGVDKNVIPYRFKDCIIF